MGQTNRVIILATSLIAILLLGSFSSFFDEAFAGGALTRTPLPTNGPIGDFLCYFVTPGPVALTFGTIDLLDQFGEMNGTRAFEILEFCASANKKRSTRTL